MLIAKTLLYSYLSMYIVVWQGFGISTGKSENHEKLRIICPVCPGGFIK